MSACMSIALPPDLRPVPFWAWNGELNKDDLCSQIRAMKQMGFGGFFIHSRFGLKTPYLGEKWFECVRICIDEAEKQGLQAWLYDEDRWPSGSAGGKVTRRHPEYAQQGLDYAFEDSPVFDGLAQFAVKRRNGVLISWRRFTVSDTLGREECFLRCFPVTVPASSACNGAQYPDVMNPDAVREFLRCTHERYRENLGPLLWKVPGIFTDEPTCNGFVGKLPWTPRLPEAFRSKYGYNLLDCLPELFFEFNGCRVSKVRLDFYNLIAELFRDSYAKQIFQWCEEHRIRLAGHILGEDDLFSQMQTVGSAMRFYEYMHIPGIDVLTEHWNLYAAAKQCSSVARQQGREASLAEVCGCTGWDFPLEGHKALGDWLFALGIDLLVPHHFWYSAAGESKRDYPADISPRSPYWCAYHAVSDYFARLNKAFAGLENVCDVLVVHPMESVWFGRPLEAYGREKAINLNGAFVHTGPEKNREMGRLQNITDWLLREHLDFDFGDEEQMTRLARMENGVLQVGKCGYRAVVLPELVTIRKTTLELLSEFVRQGGSVFSAAAAPEYMDGLSSDFPKTCWRLFLPLDLQKFRTVSLHDENENELPALLYRLGRNRWREVLFLCNTSVLPQTGIHTFPNVSERNITYPSVTVRWRLPEGFQVCESKSGSLHGIPAERKGEWVCFQTSFERLESRLFVAEKTPVVVSDEPDGEKYHLPSGPFRYALSEENLLVLDLPEAEIGNESFPQMHILALDAEVRKRIGEPPRSIMAVQPWYKTEKPQEKVPLRLRFRIFCEVVPDSVSLLMESPQQWTFSLNGELFQPLDSGWKWDKAIRRLSFHHLKPGENLLEIMTDFSAESVLESLFLAGQFGVRENHLIHLPEMLQKGDWTGQGLPNYAGNVTYEILMESDGSPRDLNLAHSCGTAFLVRLNSNAEQICAYPPYRVRLNPRKGENRLLVTVCGSLRNAFGPFYTKEKMFLITPGTFRRYERARQSLIPYGL